MDMALVPTREDLPSHSWLRVVPLLKGVNPFRVARLVGRALAYPKGLILGDQRRVKRWLDARQSKRLSGTFGLFRRKAQASDAKE
jgi:hypothetical protein